MPVDLTPYKQFIGCPNVEEIEYTPGTTGQMWNRTTENNNANSYYSNTLEYISRENLKTVIFDEGITCIGSYIFYGCTGITDIALPYSITKINSNAFVGCSSLTSVQYISSEARDFALTISSGNNPLTGAVWNYEVSSSMSLPVAITEIEEEAFCGSGAEQIILHSGVENAGSRSFSDNLGLRVLIIEGNDTAIADGALDGSSNAVVFCHEGSQAEQWCVDHQVKHAAV